MADINILMLLSNSYTFDGRVQLEARSLVEEGHEVSVLCWDRDGEFSSEEIIEGVHVFRLYNTPLMRIVSNTIFLLPFWWAMAVKKAVTLRFDIIHCHDLDTLPVGVRLKKRLSCPLIYDAHEIYSYMVRNNVKWFFPGYFSGMERRLLKKVDHVITVSEPFRDYFRKCTSVMVSIVLSCKPLIRKDERRHEERDELVLSYIGNLNRTRFITEMINIVGSIKGVRLIMAGYGPLFKEAEELSRKYDNVEFKGTVPADEVIPLTLMSDVVVLMVDTCNENMRNTLTNKQFEAMVCGLPVIVSQGLYAAEITEKENCGIVVPFSHEGFRNGIMKLKGSRSLCEKLGRNAILAAERKYNWDVQKKVLTGIYRKFEKLSQRKRAHI